MRVKVVLIPELADKSGKTVSALAEESETQGMLQVILEEKETLGKNKSSEVVECEDTTVVRISPGEKRATALPEDFVDPEQVGNLKVFAISVSCVWCFCCLDFVSLSSGNFQKYYFADFY